MRSKIRTDLGKELNTLVSDLRTRKPDEVEYRNDLIAINKEVQFIDTLSKIQLSEDRAKFERERYEDEREAKEMQHNFEMEKEDRANIRDKERFDLDKKKFEFEKALRENEYDLKVKELKLKEKNDKRNLIISVTACAVPAVLGIVSNVIAMRYYNRLAVRALNMEYIDNSITPRSYNEAMSNINKFMSKK